MWYSRYLQDLNPIPQKIAEVSEQIRPKVAAMLKCNPPDVSVVAIGYNEEARILACIHSLAESITQFSVEIIVVSNASTDSTLEIAEACGVIAINQPNKGVGHARQAGLEIARGKYHLCADCDSIYPPQYIDLMTRQLEKKGIVGVAAPYSFLADGRLTVRELYWYEFLRDVAVYFRKFNRPELVTYGGSFGFITKFGRQIGWRTEFKLGEDGYMAVQLKKIGKVKILMNRKVRIRTTARTLDRDGTLMEMVKKRFKREFARIKIYFTTQKEYKDTPENMIPND